MNIITYLLLQLSILFGNEPLPKTQEQRLAAGHLPVIVADRQEKLHLVYGQDSTIYYATATGPTAPFTQPVAIATLPNLVAGAKRGPQVAITDQFVVVTAVNRIGNVFAYSLNRATGQWSSATQINDVPAVAKEGFQAVAGASAGTFHSVWLDLRHDSQNKIVGATSHDGGRTWSANRIIYRSPEGTVCECCRVSIAARNNDVYVQFRNNLSGSRDLFLAHSTDGGLSFSPPQKLGVGTWQLKGCPMDGGALALTSVGKPFTTWRRENTLYTCLPGEPEHSFANGRNVTTGGGGSILAWDADGSVWMSGPNRMPFLVGKGEMPSIAVSKKNAVCVWEADGQVMMTRITL